MNGPPGATPIGFFGVLRHRRGYLGAGLAPDLVDRWDRWYALASDARPPEAESHRPVWRFTARAGLFGPEPVAGAWRLSSDRDGRVFPFLIACRGATPSPGDPWFDAAAALVEEATDLGFLDARFERRLAALPTPRPGAPPEGAILLWRDDWEVHELAFPDGRALAAYGVPGGA